jgi:hypothetical protein
VHLHELGAAYRHLIHTGNVTVRLSRRLAVALATPHQVNILSFWISLTPMPPKREMSEISNVSGRLKSVMNNK